jgi:hypothetical protein
VQTQGQLQALASIVNTGFAEKSRLNTVKAASNGGRILTNSNNEGSNPDEFLT